MDRSEAEARTSHMDVAQSPVIDGGDAASRIDDFCRLLLQDFDVLKRMLPERLDADGKKMLMQLARACQGSGGNTQSRKRRRGDAGQEPGDDDDGDAGSSGEVEVVTAKHPYRPWNTIDRLPRLNPVRDVLQLLRDSPPASEFFALTRHDAHPQERSSNWMFSITSSCKYMATLQSRMDLDHVRWLFVAISIADAERLVAGLDESTVADDAEAWWLSDASAATTLMSRMRAIFDGRSAIDREIQQWTACGRKLLKICQHPELGCGLGLVLLMSSQLSKFFLTKRLTVRESSEHYRKGLAKLQRLVADAPTDLIANADKVANEYRAYLAEPFERERRVEDEESGSQ